MNWKLNHVPILLAASVLALVGLVFFQYKWIAHSKRLSDEIFEQQVSMAVCATIEECGIANSCLPEYCALLCQPTGEKDSNLHALHESIHHDRFHQELKKSFDFYNINMPFELTQSSDSQEVHAAEDKPMCVVNIPSEENEEESFISIVFPEKDTYMLGKLKYMIGASLLILLFTAIVLLVANWWLLRQKQLLRRNVEMYNSMAHEFRTPLTNISLASDLISKKLSDPKDHKFLDIIRTENARLISQVEHVLHMAKLGSGEYPLQHERIHLLGLITEVQQEMEMQIEEKKATVDVFNLSPDLEIYGDRQHLTNVFRNLIDNALKFSKHPPLIHISAREERDGVLISVQDNGIGIPASQSRLIFEKFQQIPNDSSGSAKGFGLGLAYVKRIIELHKGFIQVDCGMDQGSRFNVFLPKLS